MPAEEVGAAYIALRASVAGFAEQARTEVNQALAPIRERAVIPIRAVVAGGSASPTGSFAAVGNAATKMGNEAESAHAQVASSGHRAYERVSLDHGGIRGRFSETLRAASAMGGGIALAYGAFSQGRQAIQVTNELAHATNLLSTATGLSAHQASAWISVAQSQGISSSQVQTSFNALAKATTGASAAFQKAGSAAQVELGKVHTEQIRVTSDSIAYNDAVQKYGQTSSEATSKLATLSAAHATLKSYIDKTTQSVSGTAAAFSALGITQQQLQSVQGNLPAELGLIADKFQAMGAGSDRATLAQQLFGRGYSAMLPLLAQGSSGIQKNIDMATKYGATLSGPTLAGMDKLRGEQQQLSLEMTGLRVKVATALEPALISLGLKAISVTTQIANAFTTGFGIAKRAMDTFLQSPYGKEFSTIAQEAISFAGQVRRVFERDLSKPLSFGGLFTTFGHDLTTKLPKMAEDFWTQLNKDLFASGQNITIPASVRTRIDMHHEGIAPTQLTGAGLFPGSNFVEQGKVLGKGILVGMWDSLGTVAKDSGRLGAFLTKMMNDAMTWVTKGGGAATILKGSLELINALISVAFDPSFWKDNWLLILQVAAAVFPFERFATFGGRILEGLFGSGAVSKIGDFLVKPIEDVAVFLATHVESATAKLASRFGSIGSRVVRWIGGGLARGVLDLPDLVARSFKDVGEVIDGAWNASVGHILDDLGAGILGRIILQMARFAAKTTLINFFFTLGKDIVGAIVGGLVRLPIIGTIIQQAFKVVERIMRDALDVVTAIFHFWGDLFHGRWSKLWGDLKNIVHASLQLVIDIFTGTGQLIVATAARLASRTVSGFMSEIHKLPGQVRTGLEAIGPKILSLGSWLINEGLKLGKELAQGIISGIESLPGKAKDAVVGVVSRAKSDVEHFFGIGSPSRVFRDDIGKPLSDGIISGFDSLRDDMISAIQPPTLRALSSAQNATQPHAKPIGAGISTGIIAGLNPLQAMLSNSLISASNGALSAAKKALGISSPSSVYAEQIGKPLADGIVSGMGGLQSALVKKITAAAQAATAHAGSFGGGGPQGSAATGANQVLGRQLMLAHGWSADQWGALQALWNRESGWNANAVNPSSGAAGIPQALGHGHVFNLGDARAQIEWGLSYIAARYGSPAAAWAHEESVGWYHQGGVQQGSPTRDYPAMLRGQEVVFTPEQMKALKGGTINIDKVIVMEASSGRGFVSELNEIAKRVG